MNQIEIWNIVKIEGTDIRIDFLRREMIPEIESTCDYCQLDLDPYLGIPIEISKKDESDIILWRMKNWGFEQFRYAEFDGFDILVFITINGNGERLIQRISELHPKLKFNMEYSISEDNDLRKELIIENGVILNSKEYSFKRFNSILSKTRRLVSKAISATKKNKK